MGAGTAVAQAIPLAAGPLLTRLYDPYEFGLMTSTVALALLLSVVATARYELAIVLPESDRDARALAGAAAILASVVCVAAMALIALAEIVAPAMAGSSRLGPWIAAVPAIAWLMACGQIGNCIANRTRDYPRMAGAAIVQQAVAAAVACLLGVVSAPFNGLIVGRIAGHATYAAAFLQRLRGLIVERTRSWTLAECREAARRYRQFPQYNLPYSLVGSFSRDFIVLALTYQHYVEAAGMYGVARMVVSAPVFFVSSTLTQVFFREASERIGTPAFAALVARLLRTVAFAGAPFMAWLAYWGPSCSAAYSGRDGSRQAPTPPRSVFPRRCICYRPGRLGPSRSVSSSGCRFNCRWRPMPCQSSLCSVCSLPADRRWMLSSDSSSARSRITWSACH